MLKEKSGFICRAVCYVLLLIASFLLVRSVSADPGTGEPPPWERLDLGAGGVAEDMQLVYHENGSAGDQVWAACANGAIFRATWNSGSWGSWNGYLYGKHFRGVDAIEVDGVEYVLGAGHEGLRYETGPSFPNVWIRPNQSDYPENWKMALTHDADFYCQTDSTFPTTPVQNYFMILSSAIGTGQAAQNPGIYRWDQTSIPPGFIRVDSLRSAAPGRSFNKLRRDVRDPNVVYGICRAKLQALGGVYKFQGSYTAASPTFHELTFKVDGAAITVRDVFGFNQWKYNSDSVYTYILAKYKSTGADSVYSVFTALNLDTSSTVYGTTDDAMDVVNTGRNGFGFNASNIDNDHVLRCPCLQTNSAGWRASPTAAAPACITISGLRRARRECGTWTGPISAKRPLQSFQQVVIWSM
jgi:hypothetical protein